MRKTLRSRFLVHWTGKDIDGAGLTDEEVRHRYVERTEKTLITGLWMTRPGERIYCGGLREFGHSVPMTCFSEVLLSRVMEHTARYGRLGFAFDRIWVLDHQGSPVLYVREDSRESMVALRFGACIRRVQDNAGILQDLLCEGVPEKIVGNLCRRAKEAEHLLLDFGCLLKPMSTAGTDDFEFLEEAEWRIFHDESWNSSFAAANRRELFGDSWERSALGERHPDFVENKDGTPPFFLRFGPDDLALLLVPDNQTRARLWRSPEVKSFVEQRDSVLPILTLEECESF